MKTLKQFIDDLKRNRCRVLSLSFKSPSLIFLKVEPPQSSEKVGGFLLPQALPNQPILMLQLRLNTEISYEENEPGVFDVRIENPRKPFTEQELKALAAQESIQFIKAKNGG